MRVIAGRHARRRLVAPEGWSTRPSAGRLREALFSALGAAVDGTRVVDLFAGSGALGIESLSRGATHVTFVENDPRALRAIRRNLDALGIGREECTVLRADAWRWLDALDGAAGPAAGLVLADPPYASEGLAVLLPRTYHWVQSAAVDAFVLEHPADLDVDPPGPAVRLRTRRHGRGAFTIVEPAPSSPEGASA